MAGRCWVTDEVTLPDGRHPILDVRDAWCAVCKVSIPDGQHLGEAQGFEHAEGCPPTRWFAIACRDCGGWVYLTWAERSDYAIDWWLAGRDPE